MCYLICSWVHVTQNRKRLQAGRLQAGCRLWCVWLFSLSHNQQGYIEVPLRILHSAVRRSGSVPLRSHQSNKVMTLAAATPSISSAVVHDVPTLTTAALSTGSIALDTLHLRHRVQRSIEDNLHAPRHSGRTQHSRDYDGAFFHHIMIGRQCQFQRGRQRKHGACRQDD